MLIRVQTTSGMKRITVPDDAKLEEFRDLVSKSLNISSSNLKLSKNRSSNDCINFNKSISLKKAGLNHGDILHLIGLDTRFDVVNNTNDNTCKTEYIETDLDKQMDKIDGKPGDPDYLEQFDPPVKFMPFHAYIKQLQKASIIGNYVNLENLNCAVKAGCPDHPPWPEGICTKCQPKPVTLSRQPYRHCDYVQFENPQIIDNFLDYWRETGAQRVGILIGRYSLMDTAGSVPFAIKCTVVAIYEPEQESTTRSCKLITPLDQLIPPPVSQMIDKLGWQPVGWIFTDLLPEDPKVGSVKHYRGTIDTYFLSAMECITAANLQNIYPNPCKYSSNKIFGSKFVTVVATGDKANQIHFEAYQVSNQAMALSKDRVLVPTHDAPELGYVKETTREQFVPEVFYSCQDEYKNQVTKVARPLPIEYLLLDMPVGFPMESVSSLVPVPLVLMENKSKLFPIENRHMCGRVQEFNSFATFYHYVMAKCSDYDDVTPLLLGNFHVLVWLSQLDLPVNSQQELDRLLFQLKNYLATKDDQGIKTWASGSPLWTTIMDKVTSIQDTSHGTPMDTEPAGTGGSSSGHTWACPHCTFDNTNEGQECEMCGLPRAGGH
ncbi:Nuclear protein localization protein 4 [Cichlidogyrus casuarinus]|uniref:Nuclear protein localization protein 4 n=1 Tax=Cichlidogyrus casuarinus TaxID=1844966 RepID=A0ABD2PW33_9PLAT